MAERVVIASIEIDESGVVRGMAQGVAAIQGGEAALNSVGKASARTSGFFVLLTGRMLSLRTAALAVGRAFSIAGLITGLAFALEGLVRKLITSTSWFQRAKAAITDWALALARGKDALGQLSRHLSDFQKAAGFPSTLETINKLRELEELFKKVFAERAKTMRGGALFHALSIDLDNLSRKINQLIEDLVKLGFGRGEITDLTGAITRPVPEVKAPPDLFKIFGVVTSKELRETIALARQAVRAFVELGKSDKLFPLAAALESITKKLEELGLTAEQIESLGLSFGRLSVTAESLSLMFKRLGDEMTKVKLQYDLLVTAAQQFAQSLGMAIEGQRTTFRSFVADMLRSIGYILLAWGALGLVTALFGYGPGARAAAIAFAAGIAALAAARLLGGSGASTQPAGRGLAAGASGSEGGATTQNIQIVIEGNVDSDERIRQIVGSIAKAIRDGTGGGTFEGAFVRA